MISNPLVSIIIPVYNNGSFLDQCIKSAIKQTWANKEIIIINDGSTDNSLTVASQYKSDIVRIINQENRGASSARNNGLDYAKGEYVQFLDGDDFLSSNKIESQIIKLIEKPNNIALCPTIHFNDSEQPLQKTVQKEWLHQNWVDTFDFLTKLYMGADIGDYGGNVQPNCWLTPMSLINKVGRWDESLSVDDDGEFFCRIVLAADEISFTPNCINYYRQFKNGKNLSNRKDLKAFQSKIKSIDLKHRYLNTVSKSEVVDRIFGRFYWENGILAYPSFIQLSNYCFQQAKKLNYRNRGYPGGKASSLLNKYLGWKTARIVSYLLSKIKQVKFNLND